jgi:hypothetical protein
VSEKTPRPRRLSDIIRSLDGRASFSIGELVDELGERAFGALMFVFAVPNIIPTPPGTSAVLGLPLVILTFQLMMGRQALWLPGKIRSRQIDGAMVAGFIRRAMPVLVRFEKVLKPRLAVTVLSNAAERLIGLTAFLLAVILFLPIPFGNILPAAAIGVLALGLAERDGLAVTIGYLLAGASALVLALVSSALYAAAKMFISVLFGL